MKNFTLTTILFSLFVAKPSFSESEKLAPSKDWPLFNQQVLLTTVPIEIQTDPKQEAQLSGTGFIVRVPVKKAKQIFLLISNAHVFLNLKFPTFLTFHLPGATPGDPSLDKSARVQVPITVPFFRHPKDMDIACMVITSLVDKISVRSIGLDMFADFTENKMIPGIDVWFAGYPRGYYDQVHNLPILRHGYIASYPKVDFHLKDDKKMQPMFVIDAQTYKGSSGSPVFSPIDGVNGMKFTGIVSETATPPALLIQSIYSEQPLVIPETIGLGNVIKSTAVRELIEDVLKKNKLETE